ncbi:MAG: VPS10 domain-containing protein [Candidatus Omnitrophota bacterium]
MKRCILSVLLIGTILISFAFAKDAKPNTQKETRLKPETFSGLMFRNIGPAVTSGRVSDIAIHPQNSSVWVVAAASGGVWKTLNAGTTWTPIFDKEGSFSIGCVTIDAHNPDIIWVGTGENVSGRHVGFGNGVYKSLNGGDTWQQTGLTLSEHIAKILIDPRDSNVVFVAAEGPLWSSGGERGVYKSTDGGQTWHPILTISKDTGVADIAMEPGNPDVMYAAAYQRRRSVAAFMGGGPESGIYKSTDAGKHWRKLTQGLPTGDMGKIGLAVSPMKPNVVYATIEAGEKEKGFYRSENRGESWKKQNDFISGATGPHYYQEIYADPFRFDRVYQNDIWIKVTDDGGQTFRRLEGTHKHSDNHAIAFDPKDPNHMVVGNDGGVYQTFDGAKTWRFAANLPITQIYKLAPDNALPFYNINIGTQDNGSLMGPSRTLTLNGIVNSDWFSTLGADGYNCVIDPENPDLIYAEFQTGSLYRHDKKTGEAVFIQPQPETGEPDRWNWDSPVILSPHCNTRLYYGSQYLYRSEDRGNSWTKISPDLSRGIFRYHQPIMGTTRSVNALWDHAAMSYYGSLTAISESPLKEGLIYVGTDDGFIQVSEDNGKHWRKIENLPGVPSYFFVNGIYASRHDANTVYVVVDHHKTGDYQPYILKSSDRGNTWHSISGDLPPRHIVWSLAQDAIKPNLLFAGTEFGIFFTLDEGNHWIKLTGGVPTISFRDIKIQHRENDLVGGSFGRGVFILDDYSPLRDITEETLDQEGVLFPVKKALAYIPRRPYDLPGQAFQGDAFFVAPNPPFGAVFTYYLKDTLKTQKEIRREDEQKLEQKGQSVPFPGWEKVRLEEREDAPAVRLTIRDEAGQIVRKIAGPIEQGFHRVSWDLRYPPVDPTEIEKKKEVEIWDVAPQGPLVVPGTFTVTLEKWVNGVCTPLGKPQPVVVESLGLASLPVKDRAAILAFQKKVGALQRAMQGAEAALEETLNHLKFMEKALIDTPAASSPLNEAIAGIRNRLLDIRVKLSDDQTLESRSEPFSLSLLRRLNAQLDSTADITETAKRNYEIAASQFPGLLEKLKQIIDVDLKKLEQKMESSGAPWTPGRSLPDWRKE